MCEYCTSKETDEQQEGVNWLKFWYNGYKNNGKTTDEALRATIIDHANAEGFHPVILIKFLEEVTNDKKRNESKIYRNWGT